MNDEVQWVLEVKIKPGERERFKTLVRDMIATTKNNEPGTLAYEWYPKDDGQRYEILERYRDSAAVMQHMASFGQNFADRFLGMAEPERFTVYGEPSSEVRQALAPFHPEFLAPTAGFVR